MLIHYLLVLFFSKPTQTLTSTKLKLNIFRYLFAVTSNNCFHAVNSGGVN